MYITKLSYLPDPGIRHCCCLMFNIFTDRNFVIANALVENTPIIYCNDGFCKLSGYSRAEVMQKSCACEFLHGPHTNRTMVVKLRDALQGNTEKLVQLFLYRKDGLYPKYCM